MADDNEAKATKAAEEAEARRLRILEASKDRMSKVAGLNRDADDDEDEAKSSKAAKLAAMRRRRFKKGKSNAKEESSDDAAGAATKTSATTEAAPTEEKPPAEKAEEEPEKEAVKPDPAGNKDEAPSGNEPQKKYKGVAKMRRAKAMQKKKEEAAKSEEDFKNAANSPAVQARNRRKMKQPIFPILMYILTTFMLFLAGLDVGLQHADDSIIVVHDFAPKQFDIQNVNPWSPKKFSKSLLETDDDDAKDAYARGLSEEDEFGGAAAAAAAEDDEYVPNIDPLFRVDLDELTRGPGILPQLARGAVRIHRMIIFVPLQVLAIPRLLLRYPPVMCLAALTIRQVIAKLVLGAKLPDSIEEDVRNAKEMTDVLSMIKNGIKNTVMSTFPTAVSMFEAFQHLRSDMYVILCGVFVGLLYSCWMIEHPQSTGLEEDLLPPDGIKDEL